jgi:hypothetical protein
VRPDQERIEKNYGLAAVEGLDVGRRRLANFRSLARDEEMEGGGDGFYRGRQKP